MIFCNLDRFINVNNIWLSVVKRSSLLMSVNSFQKCFIRLTPRANVIKLFMTFRNKLCKVLISQCHTWTSGATISTLESSTMCHKEITWKQFFKLWKFDVFTGPNGRTFTTPFQVPRVWEELSLAFWPKNFACAANKHFQAQNICLWCHFISKIYQINPSNLVLKSLPQWLE